MTHDSYASPSLANVSALLRVAIPVAIAAFATAFAVTVFATGYRFGYLDALHAPENQPNIIVRSND
jgi:hypothetical protein